MKLPQTLTPQILDALTSKPSSHPWFDLIVSDQAAFTEKMKRRPIRHAMEEGSFKVLGQAKDGFFMTVEDCEGLGIIVNEDWQKQDTDYGGSRLHIYIEDGEVRAI